jgi:protein gp37
MAAAGCAWLSKIQAKVKFLSLEPLLDWDRENAENSILKWHPKILQWLIIGQQTPIKKATMPKRIWIEEIEEAADKANTPVFLKNSLEKLVPHRWQDNVLGKLLRNEDESLRQEMPR